MKLTVNMLVFVDESGDPGMKLGAGSSDFFIVTAVIFDDVENALKCDIAISDLRKSMRWPANREFHFTGNNDKIRLQFLQVVKEYRFRYLSFALNKRLLTGEGFRVKESLIKYVSRLVFENAKPYLKDAVVVFDGGGSKDFRQQFANYLRKRVNPPEGDQVIRKVKMEDSKKNNLIQLADMVCGSVWQSVTYNNWSYRKIIACREDRVQIWPTK